MAPENQVLILGKPCPVHSIFLTVHAPNFMLASQ